MDGTTNLANQLPWTSMSLALAMGGAPVVATVAQPALGHVFLAVDNLTEKEKRQKAEINVQVSGKTLHVASVAQDLYAAIDLLMDRLDRQVMKYKTMMQNHSHEALKRRPEGGEAVAV